MHAHQRVTLEQRVAVDRDDELDVVIEEVSDSQMQRLALAAVLREQRHGGAGPAADLEEMILDAVGRAIVDDDHLLSPFRGEHGADALLHELGRLVEARDDHGDLLAVVRGVGAGPYVVREKQPEQIPGVDEEQDQIPEGEVLPEADVECVLGGEERPGSSQDGEERAVDRGLGALPSRQVS